MTATEHAGYHSAAGAVVAALAAVWAAVRVPEGIRNAGRVRNDERKAELKLEHTEAAIRALGKLMTQMVLVSMLDFASEHEDKLKTKFDLSALGDQKAARLALNAAQRETSGALEMASVWIPELDQSEAQDAFNELVKAVGKLMTGRPAEDYKPPSQKLMRILKDSIRLEQQESRRGGASSGS